MKLRTLVGGEWVDSLSGRVAPVLNPATADVIALAPVGGEADVDRAVTAATKALPGWLDTTPAERADMLLRLATAIEEHAGELTALELQNWLQVHGLNLMILPVRVMPSAVRIVQPSSSR